MKKVELSQVIRFLKSNKWIIIGLTIFLLLFGQHILGIKIQIKLDELGAYLGIAIGIITVGLGAWQTFVAVSSAEENRVDKFQQALDSLKLHSDKQDRHMDERLDAVRNLLTAVEVRSSSLESIINKHQSNVEQRLYRLEQQQISLRHDCSQLEIQLRHHENQIGHKDTQLQLYAIQKEIANLNVVTSAQTRYNSLGLRTDYLQQEVVMIKQAIECLSEAITKSNITGETTSEYCSEKLE